jgi:hypothetical protein
LRHLVDSFIVAVALSLSASAHAVDQAALDALLNEAMKHWQAPGSSVVVVRGDEVIYSGEIPLREFQEGQGESAAQLS